MIELTPEQLKHLPAVQWLVSGGRRSGRSYLIAVALLTHAVRSKEWTGLFDHTTYTSEVVEHLRLLAKRSKLKLEVRGQRFRVTGA